MSRLTDYRRKRRAEATNEPFDETEPRSQRDAEGKTLSGAFVVHLHHARRRHYDVRLQIGSVLASFAVPRGPSLDPKNKHLAIHTEDHPLDYLEFEGIIPEHQYGAGPMIAWDRGIVRYLDGPAEEGIEKGKLHVELEGMKLHGQWIFVKLAKSNKGNEWLFIKKQDEHASHERILVDELPRSIYSGLTIDELDRFRFDAISSLGPALRSSKPRGCSGPLLGPASTSRQLESGLELASERAPSSHRSKIFWPEEGITKSDLCDYYEAIATAILPYLEDRPVLLVRSPDGIAGKSFFQWNVPPGMPAWVRTLPLEDDEGRPRRGFLVSDRETLLYIANLAAIALHILAYRMPKVDEANFLTIDFDVKQSNLHNAIILANALREILEAIDLPGFVKTSGQSGLHVLVPLGKGQSFDTARTLAHLLGCLLVEEWPDIATMERHVEKRGERVYIDTGQTGASRAIVAPYSVRAVPGATISTPVGWEELSGDFDPRAFTMKTVPDRIAKIGDPMKAMLVAKPDVAAAVAALSSLCTKV
ncbi:MAG: hypothetical protein FWD69_05105 [Polyangiaceae bacterium]|nr:hypothetical protein [Polyangiaceae bacterium]